MKKIIWILIILILVISGIVYFTSFNKNMSNTKDLSSIIDTANNNSNLNSNNLNSNSANKNINTNTNNATQNNSVYTLADVAKHNSQSSCWSVVSGKVYNLTNYISRHPAGPEQILAICGKDGTNLFSDQHGGNMKIENILTNFYLGNLVN